MPEKYYRNQAKSIAEFLSIFNDHMEKSLVAKELVTKKLACSIKINDTDTKLLSTAKSSGTDCKDSGHSFPNIDKDFIIEVANYEDTSISQLSDRTKKFRDHSPDQ